MRYFTETGPILKSILIEEHQISASDESFESEMLFKEHMGKKKGILDTNFQFPYSDITDITLFDSDNGIRLRIKKGNSTEKVYMQFANRENFQWVLDTVVAKTSLPYKNHVVDGKKGGGWKRYLYVAVVLLLGISIIMIAKDVEAGKYIGRVSGRRQFSKRIFISIAELLGFYGSIALTVVATGAAFYWAKTANSKDKTV